MSGVDALSGSWGHLARRPSGLAPELSVALSVALFVFGLGCGDAEIIDAPGEHIDIHYADEYVLCDGTTAHFDRGVASVAEQLGLDLETFEHLTYTWLDAQEFNEASRFYFDDQGGWAWGSKSYGRHPLFFHEVVHMVVHQDKYDSITFLTEGIATAFEGPDIRITGAVDPPVRVDPRPILGARYRKIDYRTAAAFVSYLFARFGPEPLMELNRELRFLSTGGKLRRRFEKVYGVPLDSVVDEYLSDESCPELMTPPLPLSCLGELIPWAEEGRWVYSRVMSCGDDDVAGGIGGPYDIANISVTLEVEQAGSYDLTLISDHGLKGVLARCGGCPWIEGHEQTFEVGLTWIELEEGSYAMTLSGRASEDIPLVVQLRRRG